MSMWSGVVSNEDEKVDDAADEGTVYVDYPEANSITNWAQGADADSKIPSCGGGEEASLTSADAANKLETGGDTTNEVLKANRSGIDVFVNGSGDGNDELIGTRIRQGANIETLISDVDAEKEADIDIDANADTAYDNESKSVIRLSKGKYGSLPDERDWFYAWLALVCLVRSDNFRQRNLIKFGIGRLKKALRALVNLSTE